jgi:DNA primase
VEGYTDVIALHEAGITEAVATNGVALGEAHFELLKKFTQRAVLMFDSDEAGRGATERGFELQHKVGLEVLVAPLPPGRDPADLVAEEGPDAIRKVIDDAQPLMEFKLEQTIGKLPVDTPEAKARAVRAAAEVLSWHPDPVARGEYAFIAARRIGVDPEAVQRELSERSSRPAGTGGGQVNGSRLPGNVKVEREALQLLLTRTSQSAPWASQLHEDDFTSAARRELLEVARTAAMQGSEEVGADVADRLSPDALSLFTELMVGQDFSEGEETDRRFDEVFVRVRVLSLERRIKSRRRILQDINPLQDPQGHDALFTELVGLEAERRDLLKQMREGSD